MRSRRSLKVSHTQTSVPCGTLNYDFNWYLPCHHTANYNSRLPKVCSNASYCDNSIFLAGLLWHKHQLPLPLNKAMIGSNTSSQAWLKDETDFFFLEIIFKNWYTLTSLQCKTSCKLRHPILINNIPDAQKYGFNLYWNWTLTLGWNQAWYFLWTLP